MELADELRYRLVSWLGNRLAGVKINKVRRMDVNRRTYCAKRRRWFGSLLIATGNIYLKRTGAGVRALPNHQWQLRESEVYRVVHDLELMTDSSGWLLIPEFSGTVLATYLESEAHSETEKLDAIRLASLSLSSLHSIEVQSPDGQQRPLSHGDATAQNVILGTSPMKASWFDFDMTHDNLRDTHWRHADDLRALTYSVAERLRAAMFPSLSTAIVEGYCGAERDVPTPVLDALAESVSYWQTRPISFHLAQARVGYRERRFLDGALLDAIRCRKNAGGPVQSRVVTS